MTWLLCVIYGAFAVIAGSNFLMMRRPPRGRQVEEPEFVVLIPARNEADNMARIVSELLSPNPQLRVYVYDDDSTDDTAQLAASAGATVLRGGSLPEGWTGKNYACHCLAQAAMEDSNASWLLFLDADVRPGPEFVPALRALAASARPNVGVITGFPTTLPGAGVEPLFLAWVGWLLLATNPFGLAARTGIGHNQFTNGQLTLWRNDVYARIWPNERVRSAVLEDVLIGRLLKREGVGLEVTNLSSVMSVRMYATWRQTLDGMSKNAFEITGTTTGSAAVAALLFLIGWAWVGVPHPLIAFLLLGLSGLFAALTVRAGLALAILMPVALTLGAVTVLRSIYWRKTGQVRWKGRTYPS